MCIRKPTLGYPCLMRRKAGDLNPIVVIWLKHKANTVAAPHRNLTCFPNRGDDLILLHIVS